MSARSRTKGAAFERKVVAQFREVGLVAQRGLQYRGEEKPDVDADPFWVECKIGKRPRIVAALEQAENSAARGRIPVAVTKWDRKSPIVSLRLADFLEVLEMIEW